MKLAKSNKLVNKNYVLLVMDENGNFWPTTLCSTSMRARIRGFRKIWVANGLKEGDNFILELVDNGKKPYMNLHITLTI